MKKSIFDKYHTIIVEMLENGITLPNIVKSLQVGTRSGLSWWLKARRIAYTDGRLNSYNHDNISDSLIQDYLKGESQEHLKRKYNIKTENIVKLLQKNNIKIRDRATTRRMSQDQQITLSGLSDLNSERAAYFLGFTIADGYVSNGNRLGFTVKDSDGYILKSFQEIIGVKYGYSESEIFDHRTNKTYKRATLNVSDDNLSSILSGQNILPNKSTFEKLPNIDWLTNRHFWRGMVDGDGHLGINRNSAVLVLVGSKEIIDGFNTFVQANINVGLIRTTKSCISKTDKILYRVLYTGNDARLICSLLYEDSIIHLHRKMDKAKEMESIYANRNSKSKNRSS